MKPITSKKAVELIKATDGKIFKVTFRKKDGTFRRMNCRLGVQKDLTGKGMAYKPEDYNLMTVYDMEKEGYRMINLNTLLYVTVGGVKYQVEDKKNG